jgi:GntR family transcriptional regulator
MSKSRSPESFAATYGRRIPGGSPKHVRLRSMLEAALEDAFWKEGETIATEHELARVCGLSVGTVQRAIRDLVAAGDLERVAGRGTFVTRSRYRLGEPFTNNRYLNDDGTGIVPIRAMLVSRQPIEAEGPWSEALKPRGDGVVRIERRFDVNGEFVVLSRFYFDGDRFPRLASLADAALKTANLRLLLAKTYRLRGVVQRQTLQFERFSKEVCASIGCKRGTLGLLQSVRGTIRLGDVIYFHQLYIPPNGRVLELPSSTL